MCSCNHLDLPRIQHPTLGCQRLHKSLLHWSERLDEFKLLALRPFAVDQGPSVRFAFTCVTPRRADSASRFVEIDIATNVEADMHGSWIGRAHVIPGLGPAIVVSHRLRCVTVLQQLYDDIIELDEPHIQTLRAVLQVRHAHGARIDRALVRENLLVSQNCVVDGSP